METKLTVSEEELLALTKYPSRGFLEHWLIKQGIPYFRANGGCIWTTIGLLEAAKLPKNGAPAFPQPDNDAVGF